MLFVSLTVIYVIVCLFLIFVVLLQPGRGGLGGAFGGGASQQVFGGAGATNILQKMTAISAAIFMTLSIVLAYLSSTDSTAVDAAFEQEAAEQRSTSMSSMASMTEATMAPAAGGAELAAPPIPGLTTEAVSAPAEAAAPAEAPAPVEAPAPAPAE